jgi:hypothetical protein
MESQNHLIDAVDKHYITEETRVELNALAEVAIQEVTGLMEYLQSPEALRNARRARERRMASRQQRRSQLEEGQSMRTGANPEPEPRTPNPEPNLNTNREREKPEV